MLECRKIVSVMEIATFYKNYFVSAEDLEKLLNDVSG
jgi:hypothetical protein